MDTLSMTSATAISITRINERYEEMKRDCPLCALSVRPILGTFVDAINGNYERLMEYKKKRQRIETQLDLRNGTFDYWNDIYDTGENPTATPHHELHLRMMNQQWHEMRGIPPGTDHDI